MSQNVAIDESVNSAGNKINPIKSPNLLRRLVLGPTAREYLLEPESYPFSPNDLLFLPFPPPAPGTTIVAAIFANGTVRVVQANQNVTEEKDQIVGRTEYLKGVRVEILNW